MKGRVARDNVNSKVLERGGGKQKTELESGHERSQASFSLMPRSSTIPKAKKILLLGLKHVCLF